MEYGLYRTEAARQIDEGTIEVTLVNCKDDRRIQLNLVVHGVSPRWPMDQMVEIASSGVTMKAAGGPVAK